MPCSRSAARPSLLLSVLVLALAISEGSHGADAPAYGPIPDWVQPVAVPDAQGTGSEQPLQILLQDQQVRFTGGAQETFNENVIRINSPQGLQGVSTLQLAWKPDTDVLTVHRLHIRRADRTIDLLADGAQFTVLRRENNLEYSVLDGVLTAVLQPSGLQVGDIIDLAFSLTRTDPIREATAEGVLGGWVQVPIARAHLRALWPKASGIRWRATNDIKADERSDGDAMVLDYQADGIEPPAQPTGAPLRYAVTRVVEFSSFKTWREVSKRLAPLYARAGTIAANSPLHEEIRRIKAATAEPAGRAALALSLVEDSIRYVLIAMNQGGLVPASVDDTWSRRFGDCKAKSVLLVAILKELGIAAEVVAVSTTSGDGLDARLPMIDAFDHVIVRTRIDGRDYWLDATRSGDSRLDTLTTPGYHWGLPLAAGGSDLVPIVPVPLVQPARSVAVTIDASAGIHAPAPFHVTLVLSGDAALSMRLALASLTAELLDRALRELWSKTYGFVTIDAVAAHFDAEAGTETLSMDGKAQMEWKDDWYTTDGLGLGYDAHFTRPAGSDTSAPYAVSFPMYVRASERIRLPPDRGAFTLSGSSVDRVVAGIEYRRLVGFEADGSFYGETSIRSLQPEFPAASAAEAEKALRALSRDTVSLRAPYPYEYTERDVEALMARTPGSANEYIRRGAVFMSRGKFDLAVGDFGKALEIDPKSDQAHAQRGFAYLWQGKLDEADRDWRAAEDIDPKNVVAQRGRGALLSMKGDSTAAVSMLSEALKLEPGDTFTLAMRAQAYWMLKRWHEVIADSTEVLRQSPQPNMYAVRGMAYAYTSQMDLAAADARTVAGLPGATEVNFQIASDIYRAARMRAEAIDMLSRSLERAPNAQTYLARSRLRSPLDDAGKLEDFNAALKLEPRSTDILAMRAHVHFHSANYADAIADASEVLKRRPEPAMHIMRAAAYAQTGQPQRSTADVNSAKSLYSFDAEGLNSLCRELAIHELALGEALAACETAVGRSPKDAKIFDSKGFVLLRMGRNADAIATYDSALKLRPDAAPSLYGRGIARLRSGDRSGGEADVAAAKAIDQGVDEVFEVYGVRP